MLQIRYLGGCSFISVNSRVANSVIIHTYIKAYIIYKTRYTFDTAFQIHNSFLQECKKKKIKKPPSVAYNNNKPLQCLRKLVLRNHSCPLLLFLFFLIHHKQSIQNTFLLVWQKYLGHTAAPDTCKKQQKKTNYNDITLTLPQLETSQCFSAKKKFSETLLSTTLIHL